MSWHPRAMPRIRDQVTQLAGDPSSPLRAGAGPQLAAALTAIAEQLPAADLWWVAEDMAALAVSSAETLPDVHWTTDRPSPAGLLIWDGGIGSINYQGAMLPIDAVSWGPNPAGGMWLWLWAARWRVEDQLDDGVRLGDGVPPLLPLIGQPLPEGVDVHQVEDIPDHVRTVATTLAATWLLAAQPNLVDRQPVSPEPRIRRSYARAGRDEPAVTLVDLRRQYVPSDSDSATADDSRRRARHRWVVSGHWRDQPYGPGRAQRRRIWIPQHLRGPEGAPLLATSKVNVWRR